MEKLQDGFHCGMDDIQIDYVLATCERVNNRVVMYNQ